MRSPVAASCSPRHPASASSLVGAGRTTEVLDCSPVVTRSLGARWAMARAPSSPSTVPDFRALSAQARQKAGWWAPSTRATGPDTSPEAASSSSPWLPGASPGVAKESSASAASRTTGTCSSTTPWLWPEPSRSPLGAAMTRSRTPVSGSQEAMTRKEPGAGAASPLSGNQRRSSIHGPRAARILASLGQVDGASALRSDLGTGTVGACSEAGVGSMGIRHPRSVGSRGRRGRRQSGAGVTASLLGSPSPHSPQRPVRPSGPPSRPTASSSRVRPASG